MHQQKMTQLTLFTSEIAQKWKEYHDLYQEMSKAWKVIPWQVAAHEVYQIIYLEY
jgi:hypothetical protein